MMPLKNKKNLYRVCSFSLFFLMAGFLLLHPMVVHADIGIGDAIEVGFKIAVNAILVQIFTAVGWLTSMAVTLFEWTINPDYISGNSGLLNRVSVYTMWKFIRDFFNLFFILMLLYTAFTIVFQVAKDYKKTLLSLVLAALFVNFSFPVTRFIIDATNVPMYFFINQMMSPTGNGTALSSALSASQLKDILIPGFTKNTYKLKDLAVSQLIMAIVFLLVFSVTLLVLGILLLVRLAALVLLLIFSSVGFAASVIPGMNRYSNEWWENLWKYTLFGPASMLMLVIAVRFFAEVSNGVMKEQFKAVAANNTVNMESAGFVSSMAMFTIPIVMLWAAISLGSSMSLMGANTVTGKGKGFLKWTGKKLAYNNSFMRGLGGGFKKAGMEGKIFGYDYGKKIPGGKVLTGKWWTEPSRTEASLRGLIAGGRSGVKSERDKLHQQRVSEQVKKNKEGQVSRSVLFRDLESSDVITRQAAALSLAEAGEIRSAKDLEQALGALAIKMDEQGNSVYDNSSADFALRVIDKAKDGATVGMSQETYRNLARNDAFYVRGKDGEREKDNDGRDIPVSALETLNGKLKKDGQIQTRIDFEVEQRGGDSPEAKREAKLAVYDDLIGKMSAEDLAKQRGIYNDADFIQYAQENIIPARMVEILKKANEKSSAEIQKGWAAIAAGTDSQSTPPKGTIEVVTERSPRYRKEYS